MKSLGDYLAARERLEVEAVRMGWRFEETALDLSTGTAIAYSRLMAEVPANACGATAAHLAHLGGVVDGNVTGYYSEDRSFWELTVSGPAEALQVGGAT